MRSLLNLPKSLYQAVYDAVDHDGIEHAGYLSFLMMLAIFPFLILFMWLVNFFGDGSLGNFLVSAILDSSWAKFIDALKPRIVEITSSPPQKLVALAILSAIWTASSIFEGLRTILNRAYRVHTPPTYLIRRLVSFLEFGVMMTLTIAFVFLLVILPTIIGIFEKFIPQDLLLPLHSFFLGDKDLGYYLLLIYGFLLVCMAYYNLPSRKQKFLNVLPGAVFAVIGWTTFSMLFTYYIADFPQVNLIYGSIAGIIIALLYFYICSIILIIGAELNYHLEKSSHE